MLPFEDRARWLFLREKPLSIAVSVCTRIENAVGRISGAIRVRERLMRSQVSKSRPGATNLLSGKKRATRRLLHWWRRRRRRRRRHAVRTVTVTVHWWRRRRRWRLRRWANLRRRASRRRWTLLRNWRCRGHHADTQQQTCEDQNSFFHIQMNTIHSSRPMCKSIHPHSFRESGSRLDGSLYNRTREPLL